MIFWESLVLFPTCLINRSPSPSPNVADDPACIQSTLHIRHKAKQVEEIYLVKPITFVYSFPSGASTASSSCCWETQKMRLKSEKLLALGRAWRMRGPLEHFPEVHSPCSQSVSSTQGRAAGHTPVNCAQCLHLTLSQFLCACLFFT